MSTKAPRGPEVPRHSKYECHDDYIQRHYVSLGPRQVAKNLGIPETAVVRRYQVQNGIPDSRRREERATPGERTIPMTLPTITLDRENL